ncbi:MAG: acyltransferase [Bacteroidales bacterium]
MNKPTDNIGWIDLLRVLACFLVVTAHASDPFVAQFDNNRFEFLSGAFWGSALRPCVPLFVMMSGVLLLPVKMDMTTFYSKRMKRIVIPLIFWSLISPLLYFFYLNFGGETSSPNIVMSDHSLSSTLTKLGTFVFNFSYTTIPLWYLYMLVGLYLFMPVINPWLIQATKKELKVFLGIWIFSMCIPYLQLAAPNLGYTGNYGNMGLFGVCDWNPYGTFYYFSGFLGYLVLAYYLQRFPLDWGWTKRLYVSVPLYITGYIITSAGFLITQKYFPGNYAALEIVWYFSGINVFMMTLAIYLLISNIKMKTTPLLRRLAILSFGIYLCHFILVQIGYDLLHPFSVIPAYLQIPLIAVFAFTLSALVISVLSKMPLLKRFVL